MYKLINSLHGKFFFQKPSEVGQVLQYRINAKRNLRSFVNVMKSGIPDL